MKNILAFAGSNSSDSINKQLSIYAASLVDGAKATILDLNNFDLPIYSKDLEAEKGIPERRREVVLVRVVLQTIATSPSTPQ